MSDLPAWASVGAPLIAVGKSAETDLAIRDIGEDGAIWVTPYAQPFVLHADGDRAVSEKWGEAVAVYPDTPANRRRFASAIEATELRRRRRFKRWHGE